MYDVPYPTLKRVLCVAYGEYCANDWQCYDRMHIYISDLIPNLLPQFSMKYGYVYIITM